MKSMNVAPFFLITMISFVLTSSSCISHINDNSEKHNDDVVKSNMIIRDNHIGVETTLDSITTYLAFDTGMRGELFLDFNMIDRLFKPGEFEGTNALYHSQVLIDGKPTGHTSIRSMIPFYLRDEFPNFKIFGRWYDGAVCPDYETDNRIWEINFEKRIIAIHEKDTIPPNSVIFPLRLELNTLFITMPIKVVKGKDTLLLNEEYVLDYGNYTSFFFSDINNVGSNFIIRNHHLSRYRESGKSYVLLADKIEMPGSLFPIQACDDELIFYLQPSVIADKVIGVKPLLGFGILRHYNAMLDLKNERFIMWNYDYSKYGKDEHISNYIRFNSNMGFSLYNGEVNSLCEDMNAIKSGLKLKDKVQKINGIDLSQVSPNSLDSFIVFTPVGKDIELEILRDTKPMTIKYTTDMNPIYK